MGVKVFLLRKEITNDPDKKIFGTRGGAHNDGGSRLVLRSEQVGSLITEDHRFVERRGVGRRLADGAPRRKPHR